MRHNKNRDLGLTCTYGPSLWQAPPLGTGLTPRLFTFSTKISARYLNGYKLGCSFSLLEVQRIRPGRDKISDHLVSILLIECVRDYIDALQDSNNWLSALSHPELSNALAKIHAEPAQPWTVESLAEQCCMSRSKFATLFSQILGTSPLAYLRTTPSAFSRPIPA